ncbi:ABC transporter ATP-binding protein [Pseudanabaena sp. PCC 6802]|uniref:ABC transporter ATP-binding protein n=1 Tax=Pseudanabaena sp. PCC 6802 TaxID=118173 RepID=UPI0003474D62|nr:ABC transporter ATP-binding protein [Pseudanabaena sp. PCC 6802]
MATVRLCGVSKAFGQHVVLKDIDLTIADREFMVLVGPSGCGKSTLLRLIAGLETVTDGSIYLGDRAIDGLPPKARDIAMVFQSYALYPHMNVYDNIAFGLRRQLNKGNTIAPFSPQKKAAIDRRVRQVAESLQITALLNRKPKELSGGQKQRVALGRAIARDPQVFLMDEPLSNLDAQLRYETRGQIVQLQKQLQTTTIYVTHDQTEAMTMGNRIAVLKDGKIQQVDTPLNLYRKPANQFVAGFLGSPTMNFLPVHVDAEGYLHSDYFAQGIELNELQRKAIAPDRPLILGIRPEHLQPADLQNAHLCGFVQLVEALGSETNLAIEIDDLSVNAKVSADLTYAIAEKSGWRLDVSKLYLFDRESGDALLHAY